jgi:RNA polymerase sigma factor (sigma-70 family)
MTDGERLPSVQPKPFCDVVAEYGPMVLRVCRAVLGHADAEDAWSETFLAALKAYPELPEGSNIEAWLVTIAHRKALDQWRANSRRAVPTEHVPETPTTDRHSDDDLWKALKELPFKQRAAVAYHYLTGLPYREIGEIVGSTESAARRAAADGVKAMRATMGVLR